MAATFEALPCCDLGGRWLYSDIAWEVSWQRLLEEMAIVARVASSLLKRGDMSLKHRNISSISSPVC